MNGLHLCFSYLWTCSFLDALNFTVNAPVCVWVCARYVCLNFSCDVRWRIKRINTKLDLTSKNTNVLHSTFLWWLKRQPLSSISSHSHLIFPVLLVKIQITGTSSFSILSIDFPNLVPFWRLFILPYSNHQIHDYYIRDQLSIAFDNIPFSLALTTNKIIWNVYWMVEFTY